MRERASPFANVKWFEERKPRSRRRRSPHQLVALRLRDFNTLFRSRYAGGPLPDDDAGRDDLVPVMHHLASLTQAAVRARAWLEHWAPWLTNVEQRDIIAQGIADARAWSADKLAWRYRLTKRERDELGITTIGAIDQAKAARAKARRERSKQRKRTDRRANGSKPRADYERQSANRTKPWIVEGISRRTWYRRRRKPDGTSPADGTGPATP